jgi:hypothetical protein
VPIRVLLRSTTRTLKDRLSPKPAAPLAARPVGLSAPSPVAVRMTLPTVPRGPRSPRSATTFAAKAAAQAAKGKAVRASGRPKKLSGRKRSEVNAQRLGRKNPWTAKKPAGAPTRETPKASSFRK